MYHWKNCEEKSELMPPVGVKSEEEIVYILVRAASLEVLEEGRASLYSLKCAVFLSVLCTTLNYENLWKGTSLKTKNQFLSR